MKELSHPLKGSPNAAASESQDQSRGSTSQEMDPQQDDAFCGKNQVMPALASHSPEFLDSYSRTLRRRRFHRFREP